MGTVSYVAAGAEGNGAAGGGAAAPTMPAGFASDDLLLCLAAANVATSHATNAITGWTRRLTTLSNALSPSLSLFYKRATGSETTLSVTSPGGTSQARVFAFRNIDWTQPFGAGTAADQTFGSSTAVGTYPVPAQTPEVAGCAAFLGAVANSGSNAWNTITSHTEVWDSITTTSFDMGADYRLNLAVADTGIRNFVRSTGTVRGAALGVIIRPAPDALSDLVPENPTRRLINILTR